jgi:catechol 2,3-dioxygenase-like lactoylglutathione lyase family enzyme
VNLGRFELCLKVKDFDKSVNFYKKLGFEEIIDWRFTGYSTLKNDSYTISLYKDDINENLLNFRGGNIEAIARELGIKSEVESDGSVGAWMTDPDGNVIYFNSMPGEKT